MNTGSDWTLVAPHPLIRIKAPRKGATYMFAGRDAHGAIGWSERPVARGASRSVTTSNIDPGIHAIADRLFR